MKILKYTKKNKNQYLLTLDDAKEITLYEDIILKYNLLLTKKITNLDLILQENKRYESYYLLLKKLNYKMLSIKQAKEFLQKQGYTDLTVIDRLKKEGYLSDDLFLKSYINDQINLKISGPIKITNDLVKLGIAKNKVDDYLKTIDNNIWLEKINKYLNKKIKNNRKYSINKLKQKIQIDLHNKGFMEEQITTCLAHLDFPNDDDILKKDMLKIKQQLLKKQLDNKKELNYKLKQKLLAKGYSYDQINTIVNEEI